MSSKYNDKIIDYLGLCNEPQAVETIRTHAEIKHWNTALSACLELYVQGIIKGMKTSKGWVFWLENATVPEGGEGVASA